MLAQPSGAVSKMLAEQNERLMPGATRSCDFCAKSCCFCELNHLPLSAFLQWHVVFGASAKSLWLNGDMH